MSTKEAMTEKETYRKALVYWRRRSGLTQSQVASLIGISRAAYASYEEGRAKPSHRTLEDLCAIYGSSSVKNLIGKKEEAKGKTKKDNLYYAYTQASHENRKIVDYVLSL